MLNDYDDSRRRYYRTDYDAENGQRELERNRKRERERYVRRAMRGTRLILLGISLFVGAAVATFGGQDPSLHPFAKGSVGAVAAFSILYVPAHLVAVYGAAWTGKPFPRFPGLKTGLGIFAFYALLFVVHHGQQGGGGATSSGASTPPGFKLDMYPEHVADDASEEGTTRKRRR